LRDKNPTIKSGECPREWDRQPAKRGQKDTEARWVVKQGENQYGYKNHVNVDKTHKLIRQYTVTDAAGHNSQVFEKILLSVEAGRDVWADSASRTISTFRTETPGIQTKPEFLEVPSCMLISYGWLTGGTVDNELCLGFIWLNISFMPMQEYFGMYGPESTCWLWIKKESEKDVDSDIAREVA